MSTRMVLLGGVELPVENVDVGGEKVHFRILCLADGAAALLILKKDQVVVEKARASM
jgi:acid stress-induced BolA-like protein IbaG/YrbA